MNPELAKKKEHLLAGMVRYMNLERENFEPGYTQDDINKCDAILEEFIADLQRLPTIVADDDIVQCIKKVVLALNHLNEGTKGCLIETMEREDFCDYILIAAKQSGLKAEGDVTEEWREW